MSEFSEHMPESLLERVRICENEYERQKDQVYLSEHLFHAHHVDSVLTDNTEDRIRLLYLEHEFLRVKKEKINGLDKNMGQIFEVAISEKFLDKIHVVELGRTENPGMNGEVDGLKGQYIQFRKWLIDNKTIKKDFDREESGRFVSVRQPLLPVARDSLAIVERVRPLIETNIEVRDKKVDILVLKSMVFSMPLPILATIYSSNGGKLEEEGTLKAIENLLDHTQNVIHPIATSYHLKTYVK